MCSPRRVEDLALDETLDEEALARVRGGVHSATFGQPPLTDAYLCPTTADLRIGEVHVETPGNPGCTAGSWSSSTAEGTRGARA